MLLLLQTHYGYKNKPKVQSIAVTWVWGWEKEKEDRKVLKTVYQGTARPHFEFGWLDKSQDTNRTWTRYQSLKIITGALRSTPVKKI